MDKFEVRSIGKVSIDDNGMFIKLEDKYKKALQGLEGFSHINILCWFNGFDSDDMRNILETPKPYKKSPEIMGIFATRSPVRPNPIALTTAEVINIDYEKGIIQVAYTDAYDETPVLDIKPYTPSNDRVEKPKVPEWCSDWPMSLETSGDFDWESVFNF